MSKNPLSVFHYGNMPWKRIACWPRNFLQFFRQLRWVYQRAVKGYCDFDLCSLYCFYLHLFEQTLTEFQVGLHGAPHEFFDYENDSIQKWIDYIEEMRIHFYNSIEENVYEMNEYWSPYWQEFEEYKQNILNYDFKSKSHYHELWWKRQQELDKWSNEEFHKAWKMMEEVFFNLWD